MAVTDLNIQEALIESGHKFRKELLAMPVVGLGETRKHMTTRFGVRGKETVGEIHSGARLRPYRTAKDALNTTEVKSRTLETFLGEVLEEFDPVGVYKTIYSEALSKKRTDLELVKAVAVELARQSTEDLPRAIFTGVRDSVGQTSMDLFDGFDTICAAEVVAGNVAEAKGNLVTLGEVNVANVGDTLREIYKASHSTLKGKKTKLYIPADIKDMYDEWYLANFGAVPYNQQDQQTYLHMSQKRCELVALEGMDDSTHMFMSTKNNMLIGVDQLSDEERVLIRSCDNPKVVQFFMTAFFGVQFESIDQRRMIAGSFTRPVE